MMARGKRGGAIFRVQHACCRRRAFTARFRGAIIRSVSARGGAACGAGTVRCARSGRGGGEPLRAVFARGSDVERLALSGAQRRGRHDCAQTSTGEGRVAGRQARASGGQDGVGGATGKRGGGGGGGGGCGGGGGEGRSATSQERGAGTEGADASAADCARAKSEGGGCSRAGA
ncbi:hypothetical protein FGB62_6g253 [Gracilaria domingensis]|nr:hypothetical protein FGB62_6g253 [Gracilaria domingensis]